MDERELVRVLGDLEMEAFGWRSNSGDEWWHPKLLGTYNRDQAEAIEKYARGMGQEYVTRYIKVTRGDGN